MNKRPEEMDKQQIQGTTSIIASSVYLLKCFDIKERIMQLEKDEKILLDKDEVVESNHVDSFVWF